MKKKKKLLIILSIIIVFIGAFVWITISNHENTYTIEEKQWIENNKNTVIDISILSDIPIINYNGDGLLFSFLDYFEKETGLKFNKVAYKYDNSVTNDYVFKLVDKVEKNDLLVLQDNYVLVSNSYNNIYNELDEIKNIKIGILASDLEKFKPILDDSIELIEFDSYDDLYNSLSNEDKTDAIIVLKTFVMKNLVQDNLNILYNFLSVTKDYVLNLNGDSTLNDIIKKNYDVWSNKEFDNVFNKYLLQHYYDFKNVKDSERTDVKSKKYVYGFVENGIFDSLNGSSLKGINNLILKNFSDFSNVSISYKKFNTYSELIDAYNNGTIDIFMNNTNVDNYNQDSKITTTGPKNKLLVISSIDNDIIIDSFYALNDKNIAIVDSSKIDGYFKNLKINYTKYKNMKDLLKKVSNKDFIIIESENYNYFKNSELVDYKIDYYLDSSIIYNYVVSKDDKNFSELFNFYINYSSCDMIINSNYAEIAYRSINYLYILIILIFLIILSLILIFTNKFKRYLINRKKRKRINLSKEDKIKYIDQLTSLKNRAYLNSKIDMWDNSEVYPQSIIIIDLNNISAINDNYGREEGDRVIIEAANILINFQLPNSEIIRTDGNEFLIYLVGYSEKNIISYLRSISREMKKLSHGFGAAAGYSMINDGIKTIDDAVNEATLDMKNNKEDIEY